MTTPVSRHFGYFRPLDVRSARVKWHSKPYYCTFLSGSVALPEMDLYCPTMQDNVTSNDPSNCTMYRIWPVGSDPQTCKTGIQKLTRILTGNNHKKWCTWSLSWPVAVQNLSKPGHPGFRPFYQVWTSFRSSYMASNRTPYSNKWLVNDEFADHFLGRF